MAEIAHVGVWDRLSVPVLYVQDDSFVDVDGVMLNKGFIFPQKADKIIELLVVVGVARAGLTRSGLSQAFPRRLSLPT